MLQPKAISGQDGMGWDGQDGRKTLGGAMPKAPSVLKKLFAK